MRTLLAGVACFTIAASAWLASMAVVLHRPGYPALVGLALLFVLQSLVTIGFLAVRPGGHGTRILLALGAAGIAVCGGHAIAANLARPHFEGYAVVIGAALILQGLLTLRSLSVRPPRALSKTAPIW
jgi:hypothetical protein